MASTLQLADDAKTRISQIRDCLFTICRDDAWFYSRQNAADFTVSGLGLTGFAADEILAQRVAELPSLRHLTFIISLGNTETDIERLVQSFTILAKDLDTGTCGHEDM